MFWVQNRDDSVDVHLIWYISEHEMVDLSLELDQALTREKVLHLHCDSFSGWEVAARKLFQVILDSKRDRIKTVKIHDLKSSIIRMSLGAMLIGFEFEFLPPTAS